MSEKKVRETTFDGVFIEYQSFKANRARRRAHSDLATKQMEQADYLAQMGEALKQKSLNLVEYQKASDESDDKMVQLMAEFIVEHAKRKDGKPYFDSEDALLEAKDIQDIREISQAIGGAFSGMGKR